MSETSGDALETTPTWPQLVLALVLVALSGALLIVSGVNSVLYLGCIPGPNAALVSPFSASDFLWLPVCTCLAAVLAALWIIPRKRVLTIGATLIVWGLLWSAGLYSAFVASTLYGHCHVRMP